jgi:hypothetical protein
VKAPYELRLIQTGIVAGLFASVLYPVLLFVRLPEVPTAIAAGLLGPAIGIGGIGLWQMISLHQRSATASIAAICNLLAGALFTAMVLVQLAVKFADGGSEPSTNLVHVWLGLDVAWDVYIGLGTMLFGGAMLAHPRFGRLFGLPGLVIGFSLLALNFQSFPTPPGEAGSVDVGPLLGIWYLAATIQVLRSIPWARQKIVS